jgi:hypothetical protein
MKEFYEDEIRNILSNYRLKSPGAALLARTIELAQKELINAVCPATEKERWIFGILMFAGIMTVCMFYVFTIGGILWFSMNGIFEVIIKQALIAMTAASGSMILGAIIITAWKLMTRPRQNLRTCRE